MLKIKTIHDYLSIQKKNALNSLSTPIFCIISPYVNHKPSYSAMDLWMAGCMVFVFAALAEFVVVKVLDVQYQQQLKLNSSKQTILPLRLTSTMEKGQCQTVAMFDGTNVRSRKANAQNTPTPVGQVSYYVRDFTYLMVILSFFSSCICRLTYKVMESQ